MRWRLRWEGWVPGRQGTGYERFTIFQIPWPLACDLHLIRYRKGAYVPPHRDPVPGRRHYRLNLTLWHARRGGGFRGSRDVELFRWPSHRTNLEPGYLYPRLVCFRSDIAWHAVDQVKDGTRLVLSFGWLWGTR